jgi:hypothetical protein
MNLRSSVASRADGSGFTIPNARARTHSGEPHAHRSMPDASLIVSIVALGVSTASASFTFANLRPISAYSWRNRPRFKGG